MRFHSPTPTTRASISSISFISITRGFSALTLLTSVMAETSTPNTGDQRQGYLFSYGSSSSPLVLPTIVSCPQPIAIPPITPINTGGPDPVAPYTLLALVHEQLLSGSGEQYERMYAHTIDLGNLNSPAFISAPWMSGTQFIACMWSSNGVSGGCQDLMTVVPSGADTDRAYADADSQCRTPNVMGSWVTNSSKTLDVDMYGPSGVVSINAWPSACSDLQFIPKNGTAPYTLLITPAFHPPVNISSSGDNHAMNYTVRLTHGQAFMAAVFDSAGNSWAVGPLHSGESEDLACLAVATGSTPKKSTTTFSVAVLAGSAVGAFVVGALGAVLLAWLIGKRKRHSTRSESRELLTDPYGDQRPASYRVDSGSSSVYHKPRQSSSGPYSDLSPPIGYETPVALYDPMLSSQTGSYPAVPGGHNDTRPFPRPPDQHSYPYPFDPRQSRRSLTEDFQPQGRDEGATLRTLSPENNRASSGHVEAQQGTGSGGPRGRGKVVRLQAVGGPAASGRTSSIHEDDEDEEYDSQSRRRRNVYVVHADGGGDVHIRLPEADANVIELPPTYRNDPRLSEGATSQQPLIPLSPPAASIHSTRSLQDPMDARSPPVNELQQSVSRGSGLSDMTAEEIRARAEAALAEKGRPVSTGPIGPRAPNTRP